MADKFKIKSTSFIDNEIQIAFLEGVIMPNGEFISNGTCKFLKHGDTIYIKDKE